MMAKDHRDDKAKVSVFFAQIEGGDGTIQDGLRTLAAALGRVTQQSPLLRQTRPQLPASNKDDGAVRQRRLFDEQDPPDDVQEDDVLELPDVEGLGEQTPTRPKDSRPRKSATYKMLGELDLRQIGKQSLKEYFAEKRPSDQKSQIAVIVPYLTKIAGETNVDYDHLYTCFREVGEKVPLDLRSTVRDASRIKGWIDTSNSKAFRLTTAGENFVNHDLPAVKKAD